MIISWWNSLQKIMKLLKLLNYDDGMAKWPRFGLFFCSSYDIIAAYLICHTERSPLLTERTLSLSEVTL